MLLMLLLVSQDFYHSTSSQQPNNVDDIVETNEFIDDTDIARQDLLTQEEIAVMKAQGVSAEDMMKAQIARHERFDLKTDFSKEKWRKRKEKK